MRIEPRPSAPALLPAPEPGRSTPGYRTDEKYMAFMGDGTDTRAALPPRIGLWNERWRRWRDGFEQGIGPRVRQFWRLYRAFDDQQLPGPNQEWRDRTVIPEVFKIIESRIPKIVDGLWNNPEPFAVEGRGFRDGDYEEVVRVLIQTMLDQIGTGHAQNEPFQQRMIDGERYKQIMGHVWWKVFWRDTDRWIKTKVPRLNPESQKIEGWDPIEYFENVYSGVDIRWYPLDSVGVDLGGIQYTRRWAIERIETDLEGLLHANRMHKEKTGQDLYQNLDLLPLHTQAFGMTESYDEPRDTEHWPLEADQIADDPGKHRVELWLCWDNIEGTLTKIANRSIEIAHGMAPTPDGQDPFLGVPAVPIPGRVYGDSMIHYVGPLAQYQTRIARARADEVLLNIWQQYLYREGALRNIQWFWRPGGGMSVENADPTKPVDHDVKLLQRRPVFQEAYTEENYRQTQAEAVAGADAVSQGGEGTTKSRDVSATEINQRVLQGSSRYQLEVMYNEYAFKKPLLQKVFDLTRQNLTKPKQLRILEDSELPKEVDLRDLARPIDIIVGGGSREATQTERTNELVALKDLGESPVYGEYVNKRNVLEDLVRSTRTLGRMASRYVLTEEQAEKNRAERAAQEAQQNMAQAPLTPEGAAPGSEGAPGTPAANAGAGASSAGPTGPGGQSPPAAPHSASSSTIEI